MIDKLKPEVDEPPAPPPPSGLPDIILQKLRAFDRRRRQLALYRAGAEAAVVFLAGLAFTALADWLFVPGIRTRVFLSGMTYLGAFAIFAWRGLWPAMRRSPRAAIARDFEVATGEGGLDERLSSAVEFCEQTRQGKTNGIGRWMIQRTIAIAAQEVAQFDPIGLVSPKPFRKVAYWAALAWCVALVICFFPGMSLLAARAAFPLGGHARPSVAKLEVLPGDKQIAQGSTLEILLTSTPAAPDSVAAIQWEDGLTEELPMTATEESGKFKLRFDTVTQGFTYIVSALDGESQRYKIGVDQPPRLVALKLAITPPAYSKQLPRTVEGGDAEILQGSRIDVAVSLAGAPAANASLLLDDGVSQALVLEGAKDDKEGARQIGRATLEPVRSLAYRLRLVGAEGLLIEPPQRWLLRVIPDLPPTIAFAGDNLAGGWTGQKDLLLVEGKAQDDVGLARVRLAIAVNDIERQRRDVKLPVPDDGSETPRPGPFALKTSLDLSELDLAVGDSVALTWEAEDLGGNSAKSETTILTIASAEDSRTVILAARLRVQLEKLKEQIQWLRETRQKWRTMVRTLAPDEAAAMRGELIVLESRWNELSESLQAIGTALRDEKVQSDTPAEMAVPSLGIQLSGWSNTQHAMLQATCKEAVAAPADQVKNRLARGNDFHESAFEDLVDFRQKLGMIVARLEADAMVSRATASQSRDRRIAPILRGSIGWSLPGFIQGLRGTFRTGRGPEGQEKYKTIGLPSLDNFNVPGHGAENWYVRYEGEIRIESAGKWQFACTVNDGGRLTIAGKSVLPKESWKDQSATNYSGNLDLPEGWHPIILELYNAGGPSKLRLMKSKQNQPLKEVTLEELRVNGGSGDDHHVLAHDMADIPPAVVAAADQRLRRELDAILGIPTVIAQMAADTDDQQLSRFVDGPRESARELQSVLSATPWNLLSLRRSEERADQLVDAAQKARDMLRKHDGPLQNQLKAQDAAKPLALAMAQLRQIADRLRQIQHDLPPHEQQEIAERHVKAAKAWTKALEKAMDERAKDLDERTRDPEATLEERTAAWKAARKLESEGVQIRKELQEALKQEPKDRHHVANEIQVRMDRLVPMMHEIARADEMAQDREMAKLAAQAQREVRALAKAKETRDLREQIAAHQRLAEKTEEIAQKQREQGKFKEAQQLEKRVGDAPQEAKVNELTHNFREMVNKPMHHPVIPLGNDLAEEMKKTLEKSRNTKDEEAKEKLVEDKLEQSAIAAALEAEFWRRHQRKDMAEAYRQFSEEVAKERWSEQNTDDKKLAALTEKSESLAGRRGGEELEKILRPIREQQEKNKDQLAKTDDAKLEKLAAQVNEAMHVDAKRAELMKTLKEETADVDMSDPGPQQEGDPTAKLAENLATMIEKVRDAEMREQEAREEFSQKESQIADKLGQTKKESEKLAEKTKNERLANALKKAGAEIPKSVQPLRELAEKAKAAPEAESKDGKAPMSTEDLTRQGQVQADALRNQVAVPLAEAFRAAMSKEANPQELNEAAKVGRDLASLAAEQREAVDRLQSAIDAHAALREKLAAQMAAVAPSPEAQPTSAEAKQVAKAVELQRKATSLQEKADQLQTAADAQEERAKRQWQRAKAEDSKPSNAKKNEAEMKQAAKSAQQASEAQTKALAEQTKAIAAQKEALQARADLPLDKKLPLLAQTAADLRQAVRNSMNAKESAQAMAPIAGQEKASTANQTAAADNAQKARQMIRESTADLSSLAVNQGQKPGEGKGAEPEKPANARPASAAERAMAEALAELQSAEKNHEAYQQASRSLMKSAEQQRLAQASAALQNQAASAQAQAASQPTKSAAQAAASKQMASANTNSSEASNSPDGRAAVEGEGPKEQVDTTNLPKGVEQAEWAKMTPEQRASVRSGGSGNFAEEHQEAIRSYFQRLGAVGDAPPKSPPAGKGRGR